MFNDVLIAEYGQCPPDCRACEEACRERLGRSSAGIQSVHLSEMDFHGVVMCKQCSSPACAQVCPTRAITRNGGVVRINQERCVGCGLCILACDSAGVFYDRESKKALTCEMCDSNPPCVEACPHGLLSLVQTKKIRESLGEELVSHGVPQCQGCTEELALRLALRVFGKETFVFTGPGCSAPVISATYNGGFLKVPTFTCRMTNMPAVMTGVKRLYRNLGKEIRCVGFAGDGMTADVGFQSLSGAAERGENLIYICLDNEAYMNTGIQRSGTTPRFSWTTTTPVGEKVRGKQREPKNMPLLMAFHGISYVATATVGFPEDFVKKLSKAKAVKNGMAYLHVLVPCPTGWRASPSEAIELSRLAVETGYFPLWEYENEVFSFTYQPGRLKPLVRFTERMGRFRHLTKEELEELSAITQKRLEVIQRLIMGEKCLFEDFTSPGSKKSLTA
ncbi:MAG: 4Fe-4S binding protein [Deltaproteobacteria bacterium]|nr:4Fe-4S binding protein [Deltaproteobacteria bacterium]